MILIVKLSHQNQIANVLQAPVATAVIFYQPIIFAMVGQNIIANGELTAVVMSGKQPTPNIAVEIARVVTVEQKIADGQSFKIASLGKLARRTVNPVFAVELV